MEFNNHHTNNTGGASDARGDSQATPFSWQNPAFPMPSPRARSAGGDRIPGSVRSSRPRWTPAKHARILADIKATRTDIDPSFPRPVPVPDSAAPASVQTQVKAAVQSAVESTRSYFFSLTEDAVEQLYGPASPTMIPPAAHGAGSAGAAAPLTLAEQKAYFLSALVKSGFSQQQAEDIVVAWTAAGIPLNDLTFPGACKDTYEFKAEDQALTSSRAHIRLHVEPSGIERMLKCYPTPTGEDPTGFCELTGIDPRAPRYELRSLLASHIANKLLGWDITPPTELAFLGGRVCLMTPVVQGLTLKSALTNNLPMHMCFNTAWQDGALHTANWKGQFQEGFRQDYIRLSLFAMLVGDPDRHFEQFITQARQPAYLKGIDWDKAFGSKITDDRIHPSPATGSYRAVWVDSVPQKVADEFGRLNEVSLRTAARTFGLTEAEIAALISRYELVKKKLAAIKKT